MVAGGKRIKADAVHHLRVNRPLEEGVVQRAGQRVARMEFEQVFGAGNGFEHRSLTGKATQLHLRGHAVQGQLGGGKGIQLGVVVVDVGDVEFQRFEAGLVVATATGERQTHEGQGADSDQSAGVEWGVHGG